MAQIVAMSDDLRTQLQTTLGAAYTLDRELGGGGMSRVFVARETALGREVVSRDGRWMVFDSDRAGVMQIFRMSVDGGSIQQLTQGSSPSFKPIFSPAGSEVSITRS